MLIHEASDSYQLGEQKWRPMLLLYLKDGPDFVRSFWLGSSGTVVARNRVDFKSRFEVICLRVGGLTVRISELDDLSSIFSNLRRRSFGGK